MGSSSKKDTAQQQLENKVALIMIAAILGLAIIYLIWTLISKQRQRSNQPLQQEQQIEESNIQQRGSSRMRNIRPAGAIAAASDNRNDGNASSTNGNENDISNEENRVEEAGGDDVGDDSDVGGTQEAQNISAGVSSGQGMKMTKKQMMKMQKKREKQEEKEAREAYLAHRREIETRKLEEEREEKERKAAKKDEDDERRKMIEKERAEKAQQELDLWKDYIEVSEVGASNNGPEMDEATKNQEFVNFVIENRVVTFESLASAFDLSIQDVVNKLKDLEKERRIQGIFTDRGKYIFLTKEDLENVANYIKRKGKVTIPELVDECSRMIDLSPKPVTTTLIDESS